MFDNKNLNPMFRSPTQIKNIVIKESSNVRKTRKTRIDKKKDIKIPLSVEHTRKLRVLALKLNKENPYSITECVSILISRGLQRNSLYFAEEKYDPSDATVRAKLISYEYDKLFNFSLEWNYNSMRRTAHRILVGMIERYSGEDN